MTREERLELIRQIKTYKEPLDGSESFVLSWCWFRGEVIFRKLTDDELFNLLKELQDT